MCKKEVFKLRNNPHGNKTNKQLEDYLKSANQKDLFYGMALEEKKRRIREGIWTRKISTNK